METWPLRFRFTFYREIHRCYYGVLYKQERMMSNVVDWICIHFNRSIYCWKGI